MPIQKTKKPAKKTGTKPAVKGKPAAVKPIAVKPAAVKKTVNGKNGRPAKPATAPPATPSPKPAPPTEAKADGKLQFKAFDRGIQLFQKRNFKEAKEMFEKASQGPNREMGSNALSHIRMCERRLAAPPPAPKSAEEHYNYGIALINMRNLDQAREHLTVALEMEPRADHIHYAMGVCLALSGDAAGAYDSLKRAIELQPRNRMVAIQDSDLDAISSQPRINRLLYPEKNF
jgi:tetratricopeptide (TPR) repeat protein